jgi:hypothetical protein
LLSTRTLGGLTDEEEQLGELAFEIAAPEVGCR